MFTGVATRSTGNIEVVKHHFAAGAHVDAISVISWTPLHYAALFGRKEIVELLISKSADVIAKSVEGRTMLDITYGELADLLSKHSGKTAEELKAEGN